MARGRSRLLAQTRERLRHVVADVQHGLGHEDRALGLHGEHEGVAGAGVDFGDLAGDGAVLAEQDAGEEDAVLDVHDRDMDHRGVEAEQEVEHQVVGLRAVGDASVQGALQGFADGGVDLDEHGLQGGHEEHGAASLDGDDLDAGDGHCLQLAHAAKCAPRGLPASPRCFPGRRTIGLP
ncbi:MAG: hypothetical protein RLZZ233_268 [Verrucomicrobiota bacterium]